MQRLWTAIDPVLGSRRAAGLRMGWLAAAVIFAASAALRLLFLGRDGFWTGELFHVFAAKSYLANGTLEVPMWGAYREARPVTMAVAAAFRLFGESEFTARLPFALASLVFLGLSYSLVRRLFSSSVALVYLFIVGLAPICVQYSREVRMFSVQQMFVFAAASSFLIGFEDLWRAPRGAGLRSFRFDFRWLAASALFTAAAWVLHPLTLLFSITLASYLALMAAALWRRKGFRRALLSKYSLGLVVLAAAVAWITDRNPQRVLGLISESSTIYGWQASLGLGANYYRYLLMDKYPALTFILPVGVYAAVRHHGRRGLFFSLAFVPLVLTLSLFVARKSERYLVPLFPFFAVVAACGIAPVASWVWESFRVHFASRPLRQKVLAFALFSPCLLVLGHPWLEMSARLPFRALNADWKSIDDTFRSAVSRGTVVTTNPREFIYYFHRYPNFYRAVEESGAVYEPGLITDEQTFHDVIVRSEDVYFLASEWNFENDAFMTSDMRNTVLYAMAPVDHGGDRRILSYHRN